MCIMRFRYDANHIVAARHAQSLVYLLHTVGEANALLENNE